MEHTIWELAKTPEVKLIFRLNIDLIAVHMERPTVKS